MISFFKDYIYSNQKGLSLVEVIAATGMIAVTGYLFIGGSQYISSYQKDMEEGIMVQRFALETFESIKQNPSLYQPHTDPEHFMSLTTKEQLMEELPLAWNVNTITDLEQCPECPGRLGYVLSPLSGYRGMYQLTIKSVHADEEGFQEFVFLVSGG